jgi:predicted DNA-binding transcriptional regulator AlpA
VSDRKRAQTIIDMLVLNYKDLLKDSNNKDRDHKTISLDQLLSTAQLAVLFGVSEVWLEILRQKKQGPKWIVLGPRCVRYQVSDILAWLKIRARSTREAA